MWNDWTTSDAHESAQLSATRNIVAVLLTAVLLGLFCGSAALALPNEDGSAENQRIIVARSAATWDGSPEGANVQKSEVIYGMLRADGSLRETYVVNRFESDKPCRVEDRGDYSQVSNLSTTQALDIQDGQVFIDLEGAPFFYQGILSDAQLPWNIALTYSLDGQVVSPDELGGASGNLVIELQTSANPKANPVFYRCFMLQITFTLNGDLCSDINAESAVLAASGKDQTVAFTVLPGHDGSFRLSAQVRDFEMPPVQIAALPYTSVIEMPDTSEMEGGLTSLSDAISQIDTGTSELAKGVDQLSDGAASLADGAGQFGDGLALLASSSTQIVEGSAQVDDALSQIASALDEVDISGIDDLTKYSPALRGIAQSLDALKAVAQALDDGYSCMAKALDCLAAVAYANPLSEDEIAIMRALVADDEAAAVALEKLLVTYYAAQAAVNDYYASGGSPETIEAQLQALFQDGGELDQVISTLFAAADFIDEGGIDQLKQLVTGLSELSHGYSQFHEGLVQYTEGVQVLSDNYGDLSSGMSQFAEGVFQLSDGAGQLSDGVSQLNTATSNLPAQMKERMGAMMADYVFPEFKPVSFVDRRNGNVTAVQFVFLTDAIEKPEPEAPEPAPEPEPTMWDRFQDLFA